MGTLIVIDHLLPIAGLLSNRARWKHRSITPSHESPIIPHVKSMHVSPALKSLPVDTVVSNIEVRFGLCQVVRPIVCHQGEIWLAHEIVPQRFRAVFCCRVSACCLHQSVQAENLPI